MKKTRQFIVTSLVFALALPLIVSATDNPPAIPLLVYGDVTTYGSPASIGTVVSVEKNNVEIASTTLATAGKYSIQIPASYADSMLVYKLSGNTITQKVCANPMSVASDKIDLSFGSAPSGGGGGGGGGGGYTPPASSPLSEAAQKVDSNKDNKIDVLDFNALMVDWNKTGSGLTTDFNSDGKVDILDFNSLMINWTK